MSKQYHTPLVHRTLPEWVEMMREGEPFVQVGYSDAEWYCILGNQIGETTGLGQVITAEQGQLLSGIIKRRHDDHRWHFAMPEALWNGEVSNTEGDKVGQYLASVLDIRDLTIYERDIFTDYAARDALLCPLIAFLRKARLSPIFIGPEPLRSLDLDIAGPIFHHTISTPNLHQHPEEIDDLMEEFSLMDYSDSRIVLVSAGVSAAVIIDRLYERFPQHTYFDCGSIWDAFVGIGGQRQWRADLYADPEKLQAWKDKNCGNES